MRTVRLLADVIRGIASLVALMVLLAAPPILLARFVGWPLPTTINVGDIRHALGGASISDAFVLKILAVACWIAWTQVVLCTVVECAAWARGHAARSVPLGGLVQPMVRQLVITGALLLGSIRPTATLPTTPQPASVAQIAPVLAAATSPVTETPTLSHARELTCVVKHRDSLWLLAEQHLGDGMRWREIHELNHGQPQSDGRTLRDPDLIRPGWILRMPADSVGLDATAAAVVEPSPLDAPEPAPAPAPAPPSPRPAVPAAETAALSAHSQTTTTTTTPVIPRTTTLPVIASTNDVDAIAPADDPADDHFPVPAQLVGATLLAAGVVLTIDGLRRRQMRLRQPGHIIPLPTGDARHAERLLRAAAAIRPANRLDLALRLLAHQLAQVPSAEGTLIDVVRVDGDSIEILLTNPIDAPAGPFEQTGGRVWTLAAETDGPDLDNIASQRSAPASALATVGHLDGRPVLVDLEHGPLVLTGDRQRATDLIWSLALELATNAWADDLRVIVAGNPPPGLDGLDRIEVVESLDSVIEGLHFEHASEQKALAAAGVASRWSARIAEVGDVWTPTIVLVTPGTDSNVAAPPGVGFVRWQASADGASRTLDLGQDHDRLDPPGLDLDHAGLDEEVMAATGEIVAVALSDQPGEELTPMSERDEAAAAPRPLTFQSALRATSEPVTIDVADPDVPDEVVPDPDRVLVRILGPVRIEGAKNPIQRRRIKELIVYLALHPEGVTDEQIMVALWPGDTPTRSAFNQTVSRARAALGTASDGLPIIPYVQGGLYRPSMHLVSDLQLLERGLTQGRPGDVQITGDPFAGSRGFEWAYVEGQAHRAVVMIETALKVSHGRGASELHLRSNSPS